MAPALLLTAGLFVGQVQEVQVIGPVQQQQQAPTGLFGRWRAGWQDRPVWSRIQDRVGGMFGRGQNQEMKVEGGTVILGGPHGTTVSRPTRVISRVTTDEPPLLESPAAQQAAPTERGPKR